MKLVISLAILLVLLGGCTGPATKATNTISGTRELVLNEQDLQKLGMTSSGDCQTEEYQTNANAPLAQYSVCNYTVLNDTQVILELQKFTNLEDLNGTYQYSSLHLRGAKGLISQNDFGDQSRFYVNNEDDYGAQYNEPGVYYYALYIAKDEYLIHISSAGRSKEAVDYVAKMGRQILLKFG